MQVENDLQQIITHLKHKYGELRQDAEIVKTKKFLSVPKVATSDENLDM